MRDIKFGTGGDRALTMHIVRPKTLPTQRMPVFVWIHGGGWRAGSKDAGLLRLFRLAGEGYAGATIEYRLTGEAAFPAQIHDCKCAIRFLRAHAEQYHLDPKRIAVGGASAGGHLVALLGTSGGVKELEGSGGWPNQSSRVQAVCDFFGPTDLIRFVTTPGYNGHARPNSPESRLLGGPVLENKAKAPTANPITYVSQEDPPFLIIHGGEDQTVPPNQSQSLHEVLKKAGVESTLRIIPEAGHGGRAFSTPEIDRVFRSFLRKHLR